MNKKYILIIGIIVAIAVIGIATYYLTSEQMPEMKNQTFDGVTVSIPVEANLVKSPYGNYEDKELGIQITGPQKRFGLLAFISTLDNRKDLKRIELEGVPSGSIVWKSDAGMTQILVVDENADEGICVGAKDEKLAIKMANTVVFGPSSTTTTNSTTPSTNNNNYIGEAKALEIASQTPMGSDGAKATLTTFQGKPMYKVTWPDGNLLYVDAVTGTIYDKYGQTG